MELIKREDTSPICPHCDKPVKSLYYQQLRGRFGQRYVYFCSACRKVLGVSHRKGFWMG